MNQIFTLPYSEYIVADYLKKKIKKASVYIPSSRQERGVDLALVKYAKTNKILTFQIKSSKSYFDEKKISINGEEVLFPYGFWFRRYNVPKNADWNILVGIYPKFTKNNKKMKVNKIVWASVILAFRKREMKEFMNKVIQKKNTSKKDSSFDFKIDQNSQYIYQLRGTLKPRDLSKHLLSNKIDEIEKDLI